MKTEDYKDAAINAAMQNISMNFEEFIDYMAKKSPIEFADHEVWEQLYQVYLTEVDKIYQEEKHDLFMYYHLGE